MGVIIGSIGDTEVTKSIVQVSSTPPDDQVFDQYIWFNPNDNSLYVKYNGQLINITAQGSLDKVLFIGNTEPAITDNYIFWYDPTTNIIYLNDGTTWQRLNLNVIFSDTKPTTLSYTFWYDTINKKLYINNGTDYIPAFDDTYLLTLIDKVDDIFVGDIQPTDNKYKFWINTSDGKVYFKLNTAWKLVNENNFIIYSDIAPDLTTIDTEIKFWYDTVNSILYLRSDINTWVPVYVEDPDNVKLIISNTAPTNDKYDFWYDTSVNELKIKVGTAWVKVHKDILSISDTKPTNPDILFWYNTTDNKLYLNVNGTYTDITSNANATEVFVGNVQPDASLYKVWINPGENLIYTSDGVNWTALNTTGNDTYMIKLDSNDKYPDFISNKIDQDTLVIDNNKITNSFVRTFDLPLRYQVTLKAGDKDISQHQFFIVNISNTVLANLDGFKLYAADTNQELTYTYVDKTPDQTFKYTRKKTQYIAIKSDRNISNGNSIDIIVENLKTKYIPLPDLFYEIYKPSFINLDEYTTSNVHLSNGKLILNNNSYIISNKTFPVGSYIIETTFKPLTSTIVGSVCRIARNNSYGLVRDGYAYINDILLWYSGNYYIEWHRGESWVGNFTVNSIERNKMLIDRDNNKIYYYINNDEYTHTGGLIDTFKQYMYINQGSVEVYSTFIYQYINRYADITNVQLLEITTQQRKAKFDYVLYDDSKLSIIARDLVTNEILNIGIKENELSFIERPVIEYPQHNSIVNDDVLMIKASDYITKQYFNGNHVSSDWQISLNSSFTNIVEESLDDISNLTTYIFSNYDTGIPYYVRVRYKSINGFVSDWSIPVKFTINDKPIIQSIDWNETTLYANIEYTLTINAIDKTNTNLTYEVIDITNTGISITQDTTYPNIFHIKFPITKNDKDTYILRIKISDGQGGITIQDIIADVNSALFRYLDIFNDSSCISLFKFEGISSDVGATSLIEWYGNEKYIDDGIYGLAANLDTTNAIKITNFKDIVDETNGYSISGWFKFDPNDNGGVVLTTGLYNWLLLLHPDKFFKLMIGKSDWYIMNTGFKITTYDDYHHILINFKNSSADKFLDLYINGLYVGQFTFDTAIPPTLLSIGTRFDCCTNDSMLGCLVDQLRIFNRTLTKDEVDFIYKNRL